MHSEKNEQKVVHQEIALDVYLRTLLDEIPNDYSVDLVEPVGEKRLKLL
jgi:hypothetical protein